MTIFGNNLQLISDLLYLFVVYFVIFPCNYNLLGLNNTFIVFCLLCHNHNKILSKFFAKDGRLYAILKSKRHFKKACIFLLFQKNTHFVQIMTSYIYILKTAYFMYSKAATVFWGYNTCIFYV